MFGLTIVDWLFFIRLVPLFYGGYVAIRSKSWLSFAIVVLYVAVTTVNYTYKNPALNSVFSTPLVFLVAWSIVLEARRKYVR